nr:Lipase domain containing protein [Haemonchus contortus]
MWLQILISITIVSFVFGQTLDPEECERCVHRNQLWCLEPLGCVDKSTPCANNITLDINCPRLPDPAYAYNDTFARNYIYPLIGGLFGETPIPCLKNNLPYVSFYKTINVTCSDELPNVTCHGYTALDPVEKAVIIVYHGASSNTEKLEIGASIYEEKIPFFDDGHIYKYYHDAFMHIWAATLSRQVSTFKYLYPDYKLYVTGHSAGGALAGVTAAYLVKWSHWLPKDVRLITLGQPRTGDYEFALWHDAAFPYSYRINHHHDPVPHTPPMKGKDEPFHYRYEVWYDNDMAVGQPYTICPEGDGNFCSNLANNTDGAEHLVYFNRPMKVWGPAGCPP